jgi:HSP20 family protein
MATRPDDPGSTSRLREPGSARAIAPLFDVFETDTAVVVLADIPGVPAGGLEVVAERDVLALRGRVRRPSRPPERVEFELEDYFQSLTLTEDLNAAGVTARLKDGVLRVEIPKSPTIQPKRIRVETE